MEEKEKVTRAASIVSTATLLSRLLGFIRDMVVAYFFGAGLFADAFFVAFRIPNLLRRLVAEGALTVSFIPIFTDYLTNRTREEAFALARTTLTLLSLVLVALSILGILFAPWIVRIFAPGFTAIPDKFALTVLLTRILFPYIFFIGLVALAMGLLNALGRFAAPALAPVLLNVGMIASVLLLKDYFDPPILALAVGVLIGGLLQVLLQIPYLTREGSLLGFSFDFKHPGLRRIGLLMLPAAFGAAVYQFSVFISTLLASFLPQGSVSALYYADRLVQFPLGVFAIALGSAVLPSLSRQAAADDIKGLIDTLSYALRLVFFISLPAMVGLIVLAEPIIQLLFQRGHFDAAATHNTGTALVAYAVGLWAFSGVQILTRVFYSLKDTKTPVKIAIISLLFNIGLAILLMKPLKHVGLALATSCSSMLNLTILALVLRQKLGRMQGRVIVKSLLINLAAALVMGLPVFFFRQFYLDQITSTLYLGLLVLVDVILGMAVYLALTIWWRSPETAYIRSFLRFRTRSA
ncbi:MAG: murein biosynthesis integral membrane protein MurJ [Deltaproteobacteria bacterium]|nr:murein biosynthesis integral membrane protein MurJ [Deltaproteobacteria bacterium]MBW2050911.1 murein biosynthesis integral membrane protein MurJ [Deltaproteobacteria bacterium]MBW2139570.1 murein biosynthesis integral membrane protein MurJ [Deltaproteobacteria bacterium]MBW2322595.1 murein biosynthesis integral membrane protein MurJ [Deltaproteobacteria bacterium]